MAFLPPRRAISQVFEARGPGPTADMEYSPTALRTPARESGRDHSLTDIRSTPAGRSAAMGSTQSSGQPQSQAITRARALERRTPSKTARLTSATTSGPDRWPQRGQALPPECDQQLVRFSDMV